MTQPLFIDATMLYRWKHLAPVGIVRLERLLSSHLRFRSSLGETRYVMWDRGYRYADATESALLDDLLTNGVTPTGSDGESPSDVPAPPTRATGARAVARRAGLRAVAAVPEHLKPFAEQAAWSVATLAVESSRHAKRAWQSRQASSDAKPTHGSLQHRIDLTRGGDLTALGLGWEYLDHEAMYLLRRDHGIRIHMFAHDLIPVAMPHMNIGQSHLVHRHYAEMAHYADTITTNSHATAAAMRRFFVEEMLPTPDLFTDVLPDLGVPAGSAGSTSERSDRRHRLDGQRFVLSVSTVEIRKNHLLLAKIWSECLREGADLPKLVIVGRIGWSVEELRLWIDHAPELSDHAVILADVEDDELVALYDDAEFTVFPSRVEGWGMPITEALGHGKVCVHSIDPAQYEASQGLMPAFHPDDFLGWKAEILRLIGEPEYRQALEASIRERYRPRSPQQFCLDYEAILAGRRLGS